MHFLEMIDNAEARGKRMEMIEERVMANARGKGMMEDKAGLTYSHIRHMTRSSRKEGPHGPIACIQILFS